MSAAATGALQLCAFAISPKELYYPVARLLFSIGLEVFGQVL